ncbi:MAG TPA: YdcF family protein [Verrucomicrobiae bacterium]
MLTATLKFFSPLAHPICLIWVACLIGAVVAKRKKLKPTMFFLLGIALFISLVASRIPLYLMGRLEAPYAYVEMEKLESGDAVILLGGGAGYTKTDPLGINFNEASDRIITAMELMRLQKAPLLVLGGGGDPKESQDISEGSTVKRWMEKNLSVKVEMMELTASGNTHDEAVKCAALAKERGWKRVYLVTSGYHMRRAEGVFRTAGLPVIPVGCDFVRSGMLNKSPFNPLPWPPGIELFSRYAHEQAGWVVYRMRGWIKVEEAKKP